MRASTALVTLLWGLAFLNGCSHDLAGSGDASVLMDAGHLPARGDAELETPRDGGERDLPPHPDDAGLEPDLDHAPQDLGPHTWPPEAFLTRTCLLDTDCTESGARRCHDVLGVCVPAPRCNKDWECTSFEPQNPCYGGRCRCVEVTSGDELFRGVCQRHAPPCTPCQRDDECGNDSEESQTRCAPLEEDAPQEAPRYCLSRRDECGCGFRRDGRGLCVPRGGNCSGGACGEDQDCPGGFCDERTCTCAAALCAER